MIFSYGIGRVIRSKESNYSEGDFVLSPVMPVAEYSTVQPSQLRFKKIDPASGIPFTDYLSTLGNRKFLFSLFSDICSFWVPEIYMLYIREMKILKCYC